MDTIKRQPGLFFSIAFGLICLVGCIDLVAAASFALHIPLSPLHFPLAILLMLAVNYGYINYYGLANKWAYMLKSAGLLLLLVAASVFIAGCAYDLSFDGQQYHQEGLYQMGHQHWVPFYETLPKSVNLAIWVNHYPKQSETSGAVVYALTNAIETGKSMNIILLIASFCLTVSFLRQYTSLKPGKIMLISLLLAFNPVTINQIFTYLVDGQLASLLLCLIITSFFLYHSAGRDKLVLFVFITAISINVKFTAIVFTGFFIIFLLLLLYLNKQMKRFWQIFTTAAIGTFFAVVVVGFNPYVINTVKYKNVFYPLFGKHPIDIMTFTSPAGFPQKNRFEKFFITMFSHTDNIDAQTPWRVPEYKVPFTFSTLDIKSLSYPDNRIAGFGPFFSGIFLISLIFTIWLLIYKRQMLLKSYLAGYLLMLLLSVFILEEAWWARYVPQLWFIPLFLLVIVEGVDKRWVAILKNCTYAVMVINILLIAVIVLQTNILKKAEIDYQMAQMKAVGTPPQVNFYKFDAVRVRLNEHAVPFTQTHQPDTASVLIPFTLARVKTSQPLPALPMPWLMKIAYQLKKKE